MPRKRYRPEEIISKLCEADILNGQGYSVAQAIKSIGGSEVTTSETRNPARYSWRGFLLR